MHPQHFHNIFITNLRWLVVIGFNLNLPLKLLFCPPEIAINYLSLRIYYENVVDIIFLKINPYLLNYKGRIFFFFSLHQRFCILFTRIPKRNLLLLLLLLLKPQHLPWKFNICLLGAWCVGKSFKLASCDGCRGVLVQVTYFNEKNVVLWRG